MYLKRLSTLWIGLPAVLVRLTFYPLVSPDVQAATRIRLFAPLPLVGDSYAPADFYDRDSSFQRPTDGCRRG